MGKNSKEKINNLKRNFQHENEVYIEEIAKLKSLLDLKN